MNSTIPSVKSAMVAALSTADGLAGIQVSWGLPAHPEREYLAIGGAQLEEDWAALGARSRNENYTLSCYINVQSPGGEQEDATRRVFELYNAVTAYLRANPVGHGAWNIEVAPTRLIEQPYPDGREAELQFGIKVQARI